MAEITDAYMQAQLAGSKSYSLVLLHRSTSCGTPESESLIWEHGRRNFQLRDQGLMALVGPVTDDSPLCGCAVFTGTPDEVTALMNDDPAVRAGVFTFEVHPFRSFPGDALP